MRGRTVGSELSDATSAGSAFPGSLPDAMTEPTSSGLSVAPYLAQRTSLTTPSSEGFLDARSGFVSASDTGDSCVESARLHTRASDPSHDRSVRLATNVSMAMTR
jgi:hypothetical protein